MYEEYSVIAAQLWAALDDDIAGSEENKAQYRKYTLGEIQAAQELGVACA